MSDAPNPFRDAASFDATIAALPEIRRPGGLTVICIVAIVLGSLGGLAALTQTLNLVGGQQMQRVYSSPGQWGSPAEMRETQKEFNDAIWEVTKKFFWVNLIATIFHVVVAVGLVYGGLHGLRLRSSGRQVLVYAFGAAVVFELARAVPFVLIQIEMLPVIQEYLPRLVESADASSNPGAATGARMGAALAQAMVIFGMVFYGGWCLAKLVFYGVSARYLKQDKVRQLYRANQRPGLSAVAADPAAAKPF